MEKKVDYHYKDYAIILPNGIILFGRAMMHFLQNLVNGEEQVNDFMLDIRETTMSESKDKLIDLGYGLTVEVVKRKELVYTNNPVICN